MTEDFYDVLGVGRDASPEEIKRAYRKKAAKCHPDVSDDPDAQETFKKIQKAKQVLTDEEKRAAYDRLGHERFEQAQKHGGFDAGAGGAGDPFSGMGDFGGFSDIFEQFFGGRGGGRSGNRPRKGTDLRTSLELELEEVYEGVEKQFTVERPERCPECDGEGHPPSATASTCPECRGAGQITQVQQTPLGRIQQTRTCPRCEGAGERYDETCGECRGQGRVRQEATLSISVPAGIRDGQTLRMEGEGAPGENGGPNGDLLIDVAVGEHESFERDGDDLWYRLAVSFPQATFGDTVTVPTMEDEVELEIPAGTQSGETFEIDGAGMPRLRRRGHGDLHVQVQVVTPTRLDAEQREALEAFAEAGGEEIQVEEGFFERIKNTF